MGMKRSDIDILWEVWSRYVMGVCTTRRMLFPTMLVMVIAKFLEVKVADLYKSISVAIRTGDTIHGILFLYAAIYAFSVITSELQSYFICCAGQTGYRLASKRAYSHYITLQPPAFAKQGKAVMQNNISKKAQAVQDIIDVFTLNFFPTFLTVVFVSISVIRNIGLIPMMLINMAIIIYAISTVKITQRRNLVRIKINNAQNRTSSIQLDGLMNYDTVYAYNNQAYEVHKYDCALERQEVYSTELERSKYVLNLAQRSIWCALSIGIIYMACLGIWVKRITTEDLALFIGIIEVLIRSLNNFGFMYGKYQSALVNMRLVEIEERGSTGQLLKIPGFTRSIMADGVQIWAKDKVLISNASFSINKGEKVAIVGKNGVGKSSLLKALLRLHPARQGKVYIDGVDMNEVAEDTLRSLITYVPQDAHLFNDSVLYNIKYGAPKASNDEIIQLSKELGLHESISRLGEGYMTLVGEQGSTLSGGEKQKIIVLRALLRKSPILMMDEPTASLDKKAESQIFKQLNRYEDITIAAVVHNLDLLKFFDRILCVEPLGVTEVGDVKDLKMDIVPNN